MTPVEFTLKALADGLRISLDRSTCVPEMS
jgi:hypothetical protein